MPAVEAPRSFARARALSFLLVASLAGCADDPVGPSERGDAIAPELGQSPTPIAGMASASEHACALRANGVVECWGDNTYLEAPLQRQAGGAHWYTNLDVNDEHSCAVREDGIVQCWGRNTFGKAPDTMVAASGSFQRVAAGADHTCAVRTDGKIQCWGSSSVYLSSERTPLASSFVRVTAGIFHTCGLRADGVAECWGSPNFGQAPPVRASLTGSPYVSLSTNYGFTCAVRADGVVECFGENPHGEAVDTLRASSSSFVQVSAGLTHACALRADGVIQCWGQNDHGEAPATWSPPSGSFTHVAAGNHFTCGSRDDGFVLCLGNPAAPVPVTLESAHALLIGEDIQVTWSNVAAAPSFQLYRRNTRADGSFGSWTLRREALAGDTTYADTTVVGGPKYQYRVRACAAGGCSNFRATDSLLAYSTPPAVPAAITVRAVRGGVVDVSWVNGGGYAASFHIERRTRNDSTGVVGPFVPVATVPGTASTVRDTTAERAGWYRYRVRGCNTFGCSAYIVSSPVIAETSGTRPVTVTATPLSSTSVQVQWTASTNVVWYDVSRRTYVGGIWGAWSDIGTDSPSGAVETWLDTTNSPYTRYQYRVRACTTVACSGYRTGTPVRTPR